MKREGEKEEDGEGSTEEQDGGLWKISCSLTIYTTVYLWLATEDVFVLNTLEFPHKVGYLLL